MKKVRTVVGMNTGHNGGCALCVDGKIVRAITEERLTRKKGASGWLNALTYCLESTDTQLKDIDLFVFSSYRNRLPKGYDGGLGRLGVSRDKCTNVDHHLSHACSAFFSSPYEKSLVAVYDGHGNDNDTESFYLGEGTLLTKIGGSPTPNPMRGIVRAYEAFTTYFGWESSEAGKTMGLASYGDPNHFSGHPIYTQDRDGFFRNVFDDFYAYGLERFCRRHNIKVPPKFERNQFPVYIDMAAWIQSEFERAILETIKKLQQETGADTVCIAGGGALNSVTNTKISALSGIKNFFAFPAASDAGQCVGNALYGYYILGKNPRSRKRSWKNDYTGKPYRTAEIEDRLTRHRGFRENTVARAPKYSFKKTKSVAKDTAKLLADGKIVGWFQGGSELGPRALGHRSILCDPRGRRAKDTLNDRVKHREGFRPFAASVLADRAAEYFVSPGPSPFMLLISEVIPSKRQAIPAVTHVDGTCRLQTVTAGQNRRYYDLISEFDKLTGTPLVLNTSFNVAGEPIVETPTDAMQCFLKTDFDYLVLNDIIVEKSS